MAILAAAGKSVDSFPADFKLGLLAGKVTPDILKRYLMFEQNWLAKPVWGIAGESIAMHGSSALGPSHACHAGSVVSWLVCVQAGREVCVHHGL